MEIKTAAILGAGAVGAYVYWGLQEKLGDNVWFVADGSRKERLETEGLYINDVRYDIKARTPEESAGVDVLFVTLKYGALAPALPEIRAVVKENTTVISLMNGVDSEEIIGDAVGKDHLVYSVIRIASRRVENRISFDPEVTMGIYYGAAADASARERERADALGGLFHGTPLRTHVCDDVVREIWEKFALNVSHNIPQAVLGTGVGVYGDSEHAFFLFTKLREEVCAVARAKGVAIEPPGMAYSALSAKTARYSTLQDLEAGRRTEIDMFCGAVMRMGEECGIPTPYNAAFYHLVKALEEKNEGKFDY